MPKKIGAKKPIHLELFNNSILKTGFKYLSVASFQICSFGASEKQL